MSFSRCKRVLGLATGAFPKEGYGKRCSAIHPRLCRGLQPLSTPSTPRLLCSIPRKTIASMSCVSPFHFVAADGPFVKTRDRKFSTTKGLLTPEIPDSSEATKKHTDPNEIHKSREGGDNKSGKLSTVIEPTVRRKPFQNFRHTTGSNNEVPKSSNHNPKSSAHVPKRIFVNSLMNDSGDRSGSTRQQDQNIFGNSSPMSSFVKPGDEHGSYPVIAIQVARSIDLSKIISKVFAAKGVRKMRERLSVVAQLQPNNMNTTEAARFVAVFGFGSVVFFNVSPKEIATLVEEMKKYCTGRLPSGKERKDRFCVHVQPPPTSSTRSGIRVDDDNNYGEIDVVTADYCIVPELNMKSVDVISNIMAQSVALDAYNDTVDMLLADFERINNRVTNEGNLTPVDRDKMLRAVAHNNAIFLQLTKVGIKDRLDTAWNLSQYENVSEGMREEFDIDRRFEHIEFKLNLIQQNAKFFLEVLANQKSDSLEWIIIVLILLECVLMCVEMSGMGEALFAYLGEFLPTRPT